MAGSVDASGWSGGWLGDNYGRMVLVGLALLIPLGVMRSGADDWVGQMHQEGRQGRGGASLTVPAHMGRRLQTDTLEFATQLEVTFCLSADHGSDALEIDADQFKQAMIAVLNIANDNFVLVDDTVTKCTVDGWERRVSVYNEKTETETAADVASGQVDLIYYDQDGFRSDLATELNTIDPANSVTKNDFALESLGFLVIWLTDDNTPTTTGTTTKSSDVQTIGGTEVWWPWWAWLIYAALVGLCICPLLFCFFKWRRDKEMEDEVDNFHQHTGPSKEEAPPLESSFEQEMDHGDEYKAGQ